MSMVLAPGSGRGVGRGASEGGPGRCPVGVGRRWRSPSPPPARCRGPDPPQPCRSGASGATTRRAPAWAAGDHPRATGAGTGAGFPARGGRGSGEGWRGPAVSAPAVVARPAVGGTEGGVGADRTSAGDASAPPVGGRVVRGCGPPPGAGIDPADDVDRGTDGKAGRTAPAPADASTGPVPDPADAATLPGGAGGAPTDRPPPPPPTAAAAAGWRWSRAAASTASTGGPTVSRSARPPSSGPHARPPSTSTAGRWPDRSSRARTAPTGVVTVTARPRGRWPPRRPDRPSPGRGSPGPR